MRFHKKLTRTASALTLGGGLTLICSSVFALDAKEFIERYQKLAETQGQTFTYGSIEADGDSAFTVKEPAWTLVGVPPIKADSAAFTGVMEESDGSVIIGSLDVQTIKAGSDTVTVTFENAAMKDLRVPAVGETDPLKNVMWYSRFETGKGSVVADGKEVAGVSNIVATVSPFSASEPVIMKASASDIAFDLTTVPNPQFKQGMADMGYDGKFTGRIEMSGDWSPVSGVMSLPQYDFVIDNVGTLSVPFTLSGYTAEKLVEIQAKTEEMKDMSEAEREQASLEMLQDFRIDSGAIRFKDDSVTKRGLEFAAKQSGQPAEALAAGAPMMIGMGMGQLNMPDLTQMVATAVGSFLQNPGTISISVSPETPVSIRQIMEASQTNPQSIPELLNVKVEAQ